MSDLDKIEAEIAANRQKLTRTLDELTDTLAPNHLASKLTSSVEGYGGELGRQAISTAKQNPAAFALVAAGLGLLMTGTGTPRTDKTSVRYRANDPMAAMHGFDARVAAADADMRADMAAESAAPDASWLRQNLEAGLDALPVAARRRVIKARKAAIAAQETFEAKTAAVADTTRSFHHQQPLAVGALALGIGALVGALLPSTRREDALLGRRRDALMANAQAALSREMAKVTEAMQDGAETAANRMRRDAHDTPGLAN